MSNSGSGSGFLVLVGAFEGKRPREELLLLLPAALAAAAALLLCYGHVRRNKASCGPVADPGAVGAGAAGAHGEAAGARRTAGGVVSVTGLALSMLATAALTAAATLVRPRWPLWESEPANNSRVGFSPALAGSSGGEGGGVFVNLNDVTRWWGLDELTTCFKTGLMALLECDGDDAEDNVHGHFTAASVLSLFVVFVVWRPMRQIGCRQRALGCIVTWVTSVTLGSLANAWHEVVTVDEYTRGNTDETPSSLDFWLGCFGALSGASAGIFIGLLCLCLPNGRQRVVRNANKVAPQPEGPQQEPTDEAGEACVEKQYGSDTSDAPKIEAERRAQEAREKTATEVANARAVLLTTQQDLIAAKESDNKAALVEMLVERSLATSLRAQLGKLKPPVLLKRAQEAGIAWEQMGDISNPAALKAKMVELVVEKETCANSASVQRYRGSRQAADLRIKLGNINLFDLKKKSICRWLFG
eukprot:COSAG05_NODE_1153_length_5693_cov_23.396139_1_plen_473_part_00